MQLSQKSLKKAKNNHDKNLINQTHIQNQNNIFTDDYFQDINQQVLIKKIHSTSINKPYNSIVDCSNDLDYFTSMINNDQFPQNVQKLILNTNKIKNVQKILNQANKRKRNRNNPMLITEKKDDLQYFQLKDQKQQIRYNNNEQNINANKNNSMNKQVNNSSQLNIKYLLNLKQLILDNNLIEQIPIKLISQLYLLKKLSLVNNLIAIMQDFYKNQYLTHVYARQNPIRGINIRINLVKQKSNIFLQYEKKIDFEWIDYLDLSAIINKRTDRYYDNSYGSSKNMPNSSNMYESYNVNSYEQILCQMQNYIFNYGSNKQYAIINSNQKQLTDEFNQVIERLKEQYRLQINKNKNQSNNKKVNQLRYQNSKQNSAIGNQQSNKNQQENQKVFQISFRQFVNKFIQLKHILTTSSKTLNNQNYPNFNIIQRSALNSADHNSSDKDISLLTSFIAYNLRRAILNQFNLFIQYCWQYIQLNDNDPFHNQSQRYNHSQNNHSSRNTKRLCDKPVINFYELRYNGVLLLQYALQHQSDDSLQLFLQQNNNYLSLDANPQKVYQILFLSCKYSNWRLFKYLLKIINAQPIKERFNYQDSQYCQQQKSIEIQQGNRQNQNYQFNNKQKSKSKLKFIQILTRPQDYSNQADSLYFRQKSNNQQNSIKTKEQLHLQNRRKPITIRFNCLFYRLLLQLFLNFNQIKQSDLMVQKIIKLVQDVYGPILIQIDTSSFQKNSNYNTITIQQKQALVRALTYIFSHSKFKTVFYIKQQIPYKNQKLLLQIISASKNNNLLLYFLYQKNFNIWTRNIYGRIARTQKSIVTNKKLLYLKENSLIAKRFRKIQCQSNRNNTSTDAYKIKENLHSLQIVNQANQNQKQNKRMINQQNNFLLSKIDFNKKFEINFQNSIQIRIANKRASILILNNKKDDLLAYDNFQKDEQYHSDINPISQKMIRNRMNSRQSFNSSQRPSMQIQRQIGNNKPMGFKLQIGSQMQLGNQQNKQQENMGYLPKLAKIHSSQLSNAKNLQRQNTIKQLRNLQNEYMKMYDKRTECNQNYKSNLNAQLQQQQNQNFILNKQYHLNVYQQFELFNQVNLIHYFVQHQQKMIQQQNLLESNRKNISSSHKNNKANSLIKHSNRQTYNSTAQNQTMDSQNSLKSILIRNLCSCTCVQLQQQPENIILHQQLYDLDQGIAGQRIFKAQNHKNKVIKSYTKNQGNKIGRQYIGLNRTK